VFKQSQITLELLDESGVSRGELEIALLPSKAAGATPAILDLRRDPARDLSLEAVQLLEGWEYRYRIHSEVVSPVFWSTTVPEFFQPDTARGDTGRVRPGNYTGRLQITVVADNKILGRTALEVRSRKLDYLRHYRWMLRDIAEIATEVLMERFAPAEQRFVTDSTREARTLYQRFVFLKSLLTDDSFQAAIQQILSRPYVAWIREEELRPPGRGAKGGASAIRDLTRSSARVPWLRSPSPALRTLPRKLHVERGEEVIDNPPNRFVKFALMKWRSDVGTMRISLRALHNSEARVRGEREAVLVEELLESLLAEELFREVEDLTHFPSSNQVLLRREGYRDVYRAYIAFELASQLAWVGGDDVYGAGQRNVATLYEYWVFITLAQLVASICDGGLELGKLLQVTEGGLSLDLARSARTVVSGSVHRLDRRVEVELWFNRTFALASQSSWTRPMRPDISVRLAACDGLGAKAGEVWLHFDAKYRLDRIAEAFGRVGASLEQEEELVGALKADEERGQAKRHDLLKMHAYRDAIRRSAGSYVVYPGTEIEQLPVYQEILPGLGAFPLRPSEFGEADGSGAMRQFFEEVVLHVAAQASNHERGRFWARRVNEHEVPPSAATPAARFVIQPPADTLVLLGYVRSRRHLAWIEGTARYNLRAGGRRGAVGLKGRELGSDLVVLYGRCAPLPELWRVIGEPELATRSRMLAKGYPPPVGEVYLCLPIERVPDTEMRVWRSLLVTQKIETVRKLVAPSAAPGQPIVVSWSDLLQ
jgi:uncharacterized protein